MYENYLVVYIDLSSSNAYQTDEFTRESLIELIYDEIIKECGESGITTVDKKIEKYIKTHDVALKEIVNIKGYPVPFLWTKKNYNKLANFVMELPNIYTMSIKMILMVYSYFLMSFKSLKSSMMN